jgi:hypothetical protein
MKTIFSLITLLFCSAMVSAQVQSPLVFLDTSYDSPTGAVIKVATSTDLWNALKNANCGDEIRLASNVTFSGNFVLPNKGCTIWTIIRSDVPDTGLPTGLPVPGARVTPRYANVMAKIVSPNSAPAIAAQFGASYYRFIGVEITTSFVSLTNENYGLIDFGEDPSTGASATTVAQLPNNITLDRCYIHGVSKGNVKRGVLMNGAYLALVESWVSDIHVIGQDTQAVAGWNGPGPFKISDNELEAAGENILFGGSKPSLVNNIPSDIEISRNHFFKPLSWHVGDPSYAGIHWSVKNLLELKIAQRVSIFGNILENNWVDAQAGPAFLITPRTENGTAEWVYTQDITFAYNILRHSASAVNISGYDSGDLQKGVVRGRRIVISNNLFTDINGAAWGAGGGGGTLFQIESSVDSLTIDHNTASQSGSIISADGSAPNTNVAYTNNIAPHNTYGVFGSNVGSGNAAIAKYFTGMVFKNNVLENLKPSGLTPAKYPAGNFFPPDWSTVFANFANGDYTVVGAYRNAGTDDKDIGASMIGIQAVTAGVIVR